MSILNVTPFIPSDKALASSRLLELASALMEKSISLEAKLHPLSQTKVEALMEEVNSYYSNMIEGNNTTPAAIRGAMAGKLSDDPVKRNMQHESVAHVKTQQWLREQDPALKDIYAPEFIKSIHRHLYSQLPEDLLIVEGDSIEGKVIPGEFRHREVDVGRHTPPDHGRLETIMSGFQQEYTRPHLQGERKLISIMAAHHRFEWIHPFLDGNGRVGRLITDLALRSAGLNSIGVWCLSRGLAKTTSAYKTKLARADFPRQGDRDGRGQLSENTLVEFCEYMFLQAISQIDYISSIIDIDGIKDRIKGYIHARNDHRVEGIKTGLKDEAAIILHYAFICGEIERKDALQIASGGERQARRLLKQLKDEGLLSETSSRSPLRWEIPDHAMPWYFPEL